MAVLLAFLGAPVGWASSFLVPIQYTARTVFIPPQQGQGGTAAALASLGALSGLAGNLGGIKTAADQYVSLLLSANVADRLIERFGLRDVYKVETQVEARRKLEQRVKVALGRKDGLITLEVEDTSPQRAAQMANEHVAELRRLSSELALTEAQQRRAFFAAELKRARDALSASQLRLQASGFNASVIKSEPRVAAENYARLKAEATAAEVRLRTLSSDLSAESPEVRSQKAQLAALTTELRRLEQAANGEGGSEYLSIYRDFKYQETLFDLLARQFELARLDEAREAAMIQVVDVATPPELKSSPRRLYFAVGGLVLAAAISVLSLLARRSVASPGTQAS
jgi:capsule polysaccharide export protein KpsE/RkpR